MDGDTHSGEQQSEPSAEVAPGWIFDPTEEERDMLREFARRLRSKMVRDLVVRKALDGTTELLDRRNSPRSAMGPVAQWRLQKHNPSNQTSS